MFERFFTVELPLQAPPGALMDAGAEGPFPEIAPISVRPRALTVAPSPPRRDGKPLVLVVEDNPDMTEFLTECLAPA